MGNRYYIIPMLDGYSEVIERCQSSNDRLQGADLAITGPGWTGSCPRLDASEVRHWHGLGVGRIYCTGTPDDYKAVHALQDKFTVVPLSAYGKPYTPPVAQVDPELRHEDRCAQAGGCP